MFTGLVEATGEIAFLNPIEKGARMGVRVPFCDELVMGESVAINGCCLTVVDKHDDIAEFDILTQTMRVTGMGQLKPGSIVNLERAMGSGMRFGGHFVMGHIDSTGTLLSIEPVGQDHCMRVELPDALMRYFIDKGSITLDGVSLTIANLDRKLRIAEFWIIPHTFEITDFHAVKPGYLFNIEVDMVAKYVENMMGLRDAERADRQ